MINWLLSVPVLCAALALAGCIPGGSVAVACGLLVMFFARNENAGSAENGKRGKMRRDKWLIVAALAFSVAGDWMLGRRGEGTLRFECGVALFFVAHVGFLLFCLHHGRPRWLFLGALLAGYGLFFALRLAPAIPGPTLWGATLLYMLVSCFSLAAAAGLRLPTPCRQLFFAGIACIVFSDTLIACREFLHTGKWMYHYLMAPTYYASHILVAAAVAGRF